MYYDLLCVPGASLPPMFWNSHGQPGFRDYKFSKFKYLGVVLDPMLTWCEHAFPQLYLNVLVSYEELNFIFHVQLLIC